MDIILLEIKNILENIIFMEIKAIFKIYFSGIQNKEILFYF